MKIRYEVRKGDVICWGMSKQAVYVHKSLVQARELSLDFTSPYLAEHGQHQDNQANLNQRPVHTRT